MKIFVLSWMILLGSCGVIQTQNKIVSVDSTPRGAKIFYQKKELGYTPFLQEIKKTESEKYSFQYPASKNKWEFSKTVESIKSICGYHGDTAFLEIDQVKDSKINIKSNLDPTGILFRGKKYECVDVVRANIPEIKKIPRKKCNTYFVIPPESGHAKFSNDLSKGWREKVFKKDKNDCDKVILPAVSAEALTFYGIDHLRSPKDLPDMRYKNILRIAKEFKATHFVFLPFTSKGDKRTVTPKVYDIHKGKIDPDTPNKKYSIDIKQSGFSNFIFSSFRFLPNVVGFRFRVRNRLWFRGEDNDEFSNVYEQFDFGLGLGNLQYPQREWMVGTLIAPSIVWTKWGSKVDIHTIGLTLDFKVFLHLPIGGVFAFGIGGGGGYLNAKSDEYDYKNSTWSYIAQAGVEFYFFPLKRFYLSVGYRGYAIDPAKIQVRGIQVTGESHVFMEIGYFFPELRMLTRNLL